MSPRKQVGQVEQKRQGCKSQTQQTQCERQVKLFLSCSSPLFCSFFSLLSSPFSSVSFLTFRFSSLLYICSSFFSLCLLYVLANLASLLPSPSPSPSPYPSPSFPLPLPLSFWFWLWLWLWLWPWPWPWPSLPLSLSLARLLGFFLSFCPPFPSLPFPSFLKRGV